LADLEEHARRKAEGKNSTPPLALEAVQRIDVLFEIGSNNGQSAEQRLAVRKELLAPLVPNLETWTREQRTKRGRAPLPIEHSGKPQFAASHRCCSPSLGDIVATRK
jgi:hypothetical protein